MTHQPVAVVWLRVVSMADPFEFHAMIEGGFSISFVGLLFTTSNVPGLLGTERGALQQPQGVFWVAAVLGYHD